MTKTLKLPALLCQDKFLLYICGVIKERINYFIYIT